MITEVQAPLPHLYFSESFSSVTTAQPKQNTDVITICLQ
jgi:hypothetical protein